MVKIVPAAAHPIDPNDDDDAAAADPAAGEELLDTAQTDAAEESDVEHYRFKVSKTLTRRIDQYLVDRVPYLSRANVQRLIEEGLVKVDGRATKSSYKLQAGQTVVMVAPPKPISELVPEDIPLDIIYEDEYFLALNKQANLMIHPARGKWTGTLVNGLVHYGNKWSTSNGDWRPGILHRLDKNTTGIMLVAKSDEAHWRIARQFENRTIQKNYVAVCHSVPEMLGDVIDMPIGRDRYVREKQAVRKVENGGKPAVTRYEVKETFAAVPDATFVDSTFAKDKHFPPPERFSFVQLWPRPAARTSSASTPRRSASRWSATRCTAAASSARRRATPPPAASASTARPCTPTRSRSSTRSRSRR